MSPTILVVDDEKNVTHSLRRALHRENLTVIEANSGREALEILDKEAVDVIISDEKMPGMSGSELLAHARHLYPETIRIILTGQATLDAAVKSINEGEIYRFLLKPCSAAELVVTINQALKQRALLVESRKLLSLFRHQKELIRKMERVHPDLTSLQEEQDGAFVISGSDLNFDAVLNEIETELDRTGLNFTTARDR